MNLDTVLIVDESHDVIAWDSVATGWEDKLVDVFLSKDEWFLLIEVLAHHEEFLWLYGSRSFFLTPAASFPISGVISGSWASSFTTQSSSGL